MFNFRIWSENGNFWQFHHNKAQEAGPREIDSNMLYNGVIENNTTCVGTVSQTLWKHRALWTQKQLKSTTHISNMCDSLCSSLTRPNITVSQKQLKIFTSPFQNTGFSIQ
jgi:hypothetical protein